MGLKDFQQVKVVEKLVRDKSMPIEIVGCLTLREVQWTRYEQPQYAPF
jgi:pantothenate synthetase